MRIAGLQLGTVVGDALGVDSYSTALVKSRDPWEERSAEPRFVPVIDADSPKVMTLKPTINPLTGQRLAIYTPDRER